LHSEKPLRKKEEKKEKAIKVADDTEQEEDTSTLKSEDDKSNRYILFIGKSSIRSLKVLPYPGWCFAWLSDHSRL